MKKFKIQSRSIFVILFSFIIFSSLIVGCSKDDEPKPDEPTNTKYKVTYEATVSDPANYQIRVAYLNENGSPLQVITKESPFKYEMNVDKGTYVYLSVLPVQKGTITTNISVTSKLTVSNNVNLNETGTSVAAVSCVVGE